MPVSIQFRKFAECTLLPFLAVTGMVPMNGAPVCGPEEPPAFSIQEQRPNSTTPLAANISLEERGDIYMARKEYDDAVDYYYRALKQANLTIQDKGVIWNKLGIAYQQQMEYNGARRAYKESMRLRPDYGEPANNMGTTYYMENKAKKSVKYYQRAIKANPDSASFHMNLGTSYYKLKKYKEAVNEYRTALTLDPQILSEHSSGGTVMQTRGADANFYFYLAKSFAIVGQPGEAVRYLRRAFEEGFKDRKRLDDDPDLQKISKNPDYIELIKNPPVPIKD